MIDNSVLQSVSHIHFIGIGGSGMCPLAEILHAKGFRLSGSDNNESDNLSRLRALGIPIFMGHAAEHIDGAEMVVYTAAISQDNPELTAAKAAGLPLAERAELLGFITRQYTNTVAVAGTHGKTTTSSMVSQILLEAKKDPSIFIGGRLPLINANGRAGSSDTMVCEACEFQDHYQAMTPAISIILNVDADHLDYFKTLQNVIASFAKFAAKTTGKVIYNADDAHAPQAVKDLAADKLVSFGLRDTCDWYAKNVQMVNGAYGAYDLCCQGACLTHIILGVPGAHNVLNSLAAAAAATLCGATPQEIADGLAHFRGAGRRFENIGEVNGVTFIDDYAHHPTENAATIATAKSMPFSRVIAIFQPFTFSRTARHLDDFAAALSAADMVIVSDIMGSREVNKWDVHATQITEKIPGAHYFATFPEIASFLVGELRPGDLVLTMGGGDIYKCARMIRDAYGEAAAAK